MHNARIRPVGLWVDQDGIYWQELYKLDQSHVGWINGDEGDTWEPETPIIIGGLGLAIRDGAEFVSSTYLVVQDGGSITIANGGAMVASGACSFEGPISMGGTFTFQGTLTQLLASRSRVKTEQTTVHIGDYSKAMHIGTAGLVMFTVNSLADALLILDVPHGATLTKIECMIRPSENHAALPRALPTIKLISVTTANVRTNLGAATDPSTELDDYQTIHAITLDGLSVTINNETTLYKLRIRNESTDNAMSGLAVIMVFAHFTTVAMDPGAS